MEIQTDQGLLVVNLDNCISNAAVHQMVKGDCNIYTVAVATGNDGPTMLQIPVSLQCNSNVQQTFNTVAQLQHLTNNVSQQQQYNNHEFNQVPVPLSEQLQCLVGRNEPAQSSHLQNETISNKQPVSQQESSGQLGLQNSSKSASKIDYNDIYNFIAVGLIPKGTSNEYKRILKKRSHHYCIIDKTLYYGRNQPRKVLIGRSARQEILKNYHITKETGVHLGVRKMHASIASLYFWQEMYVDIATYVRDCSGCSEMASQVSESAKDSSSRNNMTNELNTSALHENTSSIWQKVEVRMYGPYSRTVRQNQYILSITDPVSKWIMALPVPNNNLANRMASFIFESFCVFGFAKCSVVGVTSDYFESLKSKYQEHCKQIHQAMPHIELVDSNFSQCLWAGQLIDSMTSANPADWDREHDKFLYKFRTTAVNSKPSPFDMMFQRSPKSKVEENKENNRLTDPGDLTDVSSKRRKLQCSILQCRHCDEDFTSKISFRIHQRKHTEEARLRGKLEGQELLTMVDDTEDTEGQTLKKRTVIKKKQKLIRHTESSNRTNQLLAIANRNNDSRVSQHPSLPKDVHRAELKATTLAAVRHMLASTKEERRKRGRYHKYPAELQEEMANYAIEHGNHETVRVFSHRLGCVVSESTIRNIVKLYRSFTPDIKEDIGRFAAAFGIESAANHFTTRLGREIRQGLVRKFKKLYLRRYPSPTSKLPVGTNMKKNNVPTGMSVSKKKTSYRYTAELKEEIGCHACLHSINDTIRHYSQKLQISLKNNTVRRFRKLYLDKHQPLELGAQATLLQQQLQQNYSSVRNNLNPGEPSTSQTIDVLNASLNVLNNPQVQSSTPAYSQPYQSTLNHNTPLTFHTLNQCASSNVPTNITMTYHHSQAPSSVIVNQNQNDVAFNQTLSSLHTYQQQQQQQQQQHQQQQQQHQQQQPQQDYISYEPPQQMLQTAVSLPQQISVNHHNPAHMVSSSSNLHPQGPALTMVTPSVLPQLPYSSHQRPLVYSQQQLAQLQSQQKQQEQTNIQQLIDRATAEQNAQSNCTQSISTSFVQSLPSNTQFSFGNSIPVLIADRDGTYTLTTTLNTEESITLDENISQPIVIKLKSQANENVSNKQQDISNVILQEDQKSVQTMIERRPVMSTSENRQTKHDTEPLTFVEVQLNCSNMEESVDDPNYVDDNDDYDEDEGCDPNPDVTHNVAEKGGKLSATKKNMKKRKESVGKRGQYTTYSPELRAEMGKYAAEHGSQRTCQHFRAQLGHDVPESTVRGLRDKYLLKREQKSDEVTSLGYSPRGRPVRLGKYDEVVQECIRELVKSGEKISSFLAIATAKQVLMQYEPSLLEANGGNIKLNITWAKSFLKRIGVNNNC